MPEAPEYISLSEQISGIREDVAYIRAVVETIPDHEQRLRKVERRIWGVPGSMLVALMAAFGVHLH